MNALLNLILFSAWVTLYLASVYWIGRYCRARARALGPERRDHYRADRDVGLTTKCSVLQIHSHSFLHPLPGRERAGVRVQ
jgi:hypothetical protein